MNAFRQLRRVPASHPCLPGHFPGRPIVPAVLLLRQVEEALTEALGRALRIRALPAVKFVQPIGPDTDYEIVLAIEPAAATVRFRVISAGIDCVQGRLEYADA